MFAGLRYSLALLVTGLLHTCTAFNQSTDYFSTPPASSDDKIFAANVIWALGSTQTLYWSTSLTKSYTIDLYYQDIQQDSGVRAGTIYESESNEDGQQSFSWTVDALSYGPGVFFLWLNPSEYSRSFTSHYFNITAAASTATLSDSTISPTSPTSTISAATSNTTSATSTTSSALATSSALTTSRSSTSTPTNTASSSNSSDSALTIGLGVGLGVGIGLLLAILAWVVLKKFGSAFWKKSHQGPTPEKEVRIQVVDDLPPEYYHQGIHKPYIMAAATELPGRSYGYATASELPGQAQSPVEIGSRF